MCRKLAKRVGLHQSMLVDGLDGGGRILSFFELFVVCLPLQTLTNLELMSSIPNWPTGGLDSELGE